jgi:hypothetical protein
MISSYCAPVIGGVVELLFASAGKSCHVYWSFRASSIISSVHPSGSGAAT